MSDPAPSLECIELGPKDATQSVIWLHGLGASGDDFVPLVPALGLPDTRFIFPHAPQRPVTINLGFVMRAWYDITSLEAGPEREPEADVRASAQAITALIEGERARGVAADQILLAGFSQGGAMALHVALRHPEALQGVLVLSAYELLADRLEAEFAPAQAQTPFAFMHGRQDPVVPHARGRAAYEHLARVRGPEAPQSWSDYAMEHQVCPEQVNDIRAWLHALS